MIKTERDIQRESKNESERERVEERESEIERERECVGGLKLYSYSYPNNLNNLSKICQFNLISVIGRPINFLYDFIMHILIFETGVIYRIL